MKSCKTLYEAQTAIRLKETIQAPRNPPPSGKTLLRLWNKIFLTEIYEENVFSDAVQIFFLTRNRNMFAGKFAKLERRLTSRKFEN